jgi:uncharacterized protein YbjT (DUF2867 family)
MADLGTTLVIGATGNTGSGVATSLLSQGLPVRALVRNPDKAEDLKQAGAEVVIGDLDDPNTLGDALFDGVGRAYFCAFNGPDALPQWINFREAVAKSGAKPRIVRLSAFGSPESRIVSELIKAEEDLKATDLRWTILQPTWFMQNLMMAAQTVKEQGAIYWDWADGKVGMIDVRDIVDCAVAAITADGDEFEGQSFRLTGPESIGMAEVAAALSNALGKEVGYVPVPHEAAKESMLGMGFPEWIVDGYVELNRGFENGYADEKTDNVEKLSGHPPGDIQTFANDFKQAFE